MSVTKEEMNEKNFESIENETIVKMEKPRYRVTDDDMNDIPTEKDSKIKLRKAITDLFGKLIQLDYKRLTTMTSIKEDTFRKWANGKRSISKEQLAMFVIGLKIPADKAIELFNLQGNPLNVNNRFNKIVNNAIRDMDSIDNFLDDLELYLNIKNNDT
jgi:hypothetical protein